MRRERLSKGSALLVIAMVAACRAESKPTLDTPKTDTPTAAAVENLEPTPPPPAEGSKIGLMPLLRGAPVDARCTTTGEAAPRLVLEGDTPPRVITIGVGDSARGFVPTYIQVTSRQARGDGQEENESVYVSFSETGSVESGRRQYFVAGSAPKDNAGLLPEDGDAARRLALQVLARCKSS